jgi:hypothetical protein
MVLGVWGGLIPFIGPYFHYSFGGDLTWHFTMQRLWLDILPGAVAVLGGFMLMTASSRIGGLTAGWIALIAGAWFAIGPAVSLLWDQNIYAIGAPHGGSARRMLEWVGYFDGLGVVIVGLAAFAMGRYFSRPRVVEEPAVVAADAAAVDARGRHGTAAGDATGAAVAEAPAERGVVRETPADRAGVAEAPAERARIANDRVANDRVANDEVANDRVANDRVADAPTQRAAVADAPASEARSTTAADARPAADAPTTAVPTATTSTGPATSTGSAATGSRRRSGGLLGRFRR